MKLTKNTFIGSAILVCALAVGFSAESCHAADRSSKSTAIPVAASIDTNVPTSLSAKMLAAADEDVVKMLDAERSLLQQLRSDREIMLLKHERDMLELRAEVARGDADEGDVEDLRKEQSQELKKHDVKVAQRETNVKTLTTIVGSKTRLNNQRADLIAKAASPTMTDKDAESLYRQIVLNEKAIEGVSELQKAYEDHQIDSTHRLERDRRAASWN